MAITFIGSDSDAIYTATGKVFNEPSGTQEGDFMLMCVWSGETASTAFTVPSDFTLLEDDFEEPVLGVHLITMGWKIRGATAGQSLAVETDGSTTNNGGFFATFRGVNTTTPLDETYVRASHHLKESSGDHIQQPNCKPIEINTIGAWTALIYYNTSALSGGVDDDHGPPAGYTERMSFNPENSQGGSLSTKEATATGTETPGDFTNVGDVTTLRPITFTLALKPAGTFTAERFNRLSLSGDGMQDLTGGMQ